MKKTFTVVTILFLVLMSGTITSLRAQQYYFIQRVTGYALTNDSEDGRAKIYPADIANTNQLMDWVESTTQPGKFIIRDHNSGEILARSQDANTWNLFFISDTLGLGGSEYLFTLDEFETELFHIVLDGAADSRYLGTDAIDPGSPIYNDKQLPNERTEWYVSTENDINAYLDNIIITPEPIDAYFDEETSTYTATVEAGTSSVNISGVAIIEGAMVIGGGDVDVTSGHGTTELVVTALNGITTKTYTIIISVDQGNSDATMDYIAPNVGQIYPAYDRFTNNYVVIVPKSDNSVEIQGTTFSTTSTVEGLGTVDISTGPQTLSILVTAQDGTENTYTVVVRHSAINEGQPYFIAQNVSGLVIGASFDASRNYARIYNANMDSTSQIIQFTESTNPDEYLIVNGFGDYLQAGDVNIGNNDWDVIFTSDPGSVTDESYITFKVIEVEPGLFTIQNMHRLQTSNQYLGTDATTNGSGIYNDKPLMVRSYWRILDPGGFDATLSALSLSAGDLDSPFDPNTYDYTATVPGSNETVTVNATANAEGAMIEFLNDNSATVDLSSGRAKDTITVTSPNGIVKLEYSLDISVDYGDADTYLTSFVPSIGTLFPEFDNDILEYTIIVPSSENSVTISATARNAGTTIEGIDNPFDISSGAVDAAVTVTSADQTKQKVINVKIRHSNLEENVPYFIIQEISGLAIGDSNYAKLHTASTDSTNQEITLVSTGVLDEYFIINAAGNYLAAGDTIDRNGIDNFWDMKFVADTTTFTTQDYLIFRIIEVRPGVYTIQNLHRLQTDDQYIGSDSTNDGSGIYNNKDINERCYWYIAAYDGIDATLSGITLSAGSLDQEFSPDILTYAVTAPIGTTSIDITATTTDGDASVSGDGIIDVSSGSKTVKLVVTSANGAIHKTYTLNITVLTGFADKKISKLNVYPTISSGSFTLDVKDNVSMVSVFDLTGKIILQKAKVAGKVNINVPNAGVYIIKVDNASGSNMIKVVKIK